MNSAAKAQPCSEATDADLRERCIVRLVANRNGCSRIVVRVEEGSVRLSEPVRSFFLRQTAIALAKQVAGVRQVIDDVEVDGEEIRPSLKVKTMETRNVRIYHCITCGRIVHAELESKARRNAAATQWPEPPRTRSTKANLRERHRAANPQRRRRSQRKRNHSKSASIEKHRNLENISPTMAPLGELKCWRPS